MKEEFNESVEEYILQDMHSGIFSEAPACLRDLYMLTDVAISRCF